MYYPYFRGKQFELIAIRESATLLANSSFVPIVEPVRASLGGLNKTLRSLTDVGAQAVVVVNPRYGDHRESCESISELLEWDYQESDAIGAGILLTSETSLEKALALAKRFNRLGTTLIQLGLPTHGPYRINLEGTQRTSAMSSWPITQTASTGDTSNDARESWLATGLFR